MLTVLAVNREQELREEIKRPTGTVNGHDSNPPPGIDELP